MIERGEHTPLWLSHHWPHDFHRCIEVRGRMVCRRCAVLYPVGLLSAVVLANVGSWPPGLDLWLVWLLPLPAFVELVGEHLGWFGPSPRRLVLVTLPLAACCSRTGGSPSPAAASTSATCAITATWCPSP